MIRVILSLFILFVGQAHAQCEQSVTADEFGQQISKGTAAFSNLESEGVRASLSWLSRNLPCVNQPLHESQVLAFHRLRAFDYFLSKDPGQTTLYLRSVLATSPNYDLVDDWAPDGSLLRRYFEVAQSWPVVPYRTIPKPTDGTIYIDGEKSHQVPQDRPYLFQYFPNTQGDPFSGIVEPGIAAPSDYPSTRGSIGNIRMPLLVASGVSALTSGTLYFLAVRAENQFWDSATLPEELVALQRRANGLSWASFAMGTVAVGTGVGALWTGAF